MENLYKLLNYIGENNLRFNIRRNKGSTLSETIDTLLKDDSIDRDIADRCLASKSLWCGVIWLNSNNLLIHYDNRFELVIDNLYEMIKDKLK